MLRYEMGGIGERFIYAIIIECYVNLVMHVTTVQNAWIKANRYIATVCLAQSNPVSETLRRYAERLLFPVALLTNDS